VILNSDVLWQRGVVRQLSQRLLPLFAECSASHHEVILPLTARLEFDRVQLKAVKEERGKLTEVYGLLRGYGVPFEPRKPDEVVALPDLPALIRETGAVLIELEPTHSEYSEAHRRAALHELPLPSDPKSDEMRDLVIWQQSLRLASEGGGALLLSRDHVHVHHRGDPEADSAGLVRVSSPEAALEYLNVRTPGGQLIEELLRHAWEDVTLGVDYLPDRLVLFRVLEPTFIQGKVGSRRRICRNTP
jgi:hypothetical protein